MQPALAPHPSMQQSSSAQDHADQVLHDQLLAAQQQHLQAAGQESRSSTGQSQQGHNIDPAIAGGAMLAPNTQGSSLVMPQVMSGVQEAAGSSDAARKTYGKRELSTSKRAEQNRAAQRAFRQRKEGYIRQLEKQVKDFEVLSESYKALQSENFQLREYIISLQSRLIDSQNEVPALPDNIDLTQPRPEPPLANLQRSASSPVQQEPQQSQSQAQAQSQSQSNLRQGQHTLAAAPAQGTGVPLAPHQHPHQPSTVPSNSSTEDVGQLNRIAVAGLGMRKHKLSTMNSHHHNGGIGDGDSDNNNNNNGSRNGTNQNPISWKRARKNNYSSSSSAAAASASSGPGSSMNRTSPSEVKIEPAHGLPTLS